MRNYVEQLYVRETLLLSVCPAPIYTAQTDYPISAKLRLDDKSSLQAYVMVFFRQFLLQFCRGQDFSGFAEQVDTVPPRSLEHPQITLARYLFNLHHEIYRCGQVGVPIAWKTRMGYAERKVALLQRSFMWLLYFARMRVRGKLYSILIWAARSMAANLAALVRSTASQLSPDAQVPLKPP